MDEIQSLFGYLDNKLLPLKPSYDPYDPYREEDADRQRSANRVSTTVLKDADPEINITIDEEDVEKEAVKLGGGTEDVAGELDDKQ
jgi:hypothetical protein